MFLLGFLTEFNINRLSTDDIDTMNLADEYMQVSERVTCNYLHMLSVCLSLVMDWLGLQSILRHHCEITLILPVTY